MGKIVLFLAKQEMVAEALNLLKNEEYEIDIVKQVDTSVVVSEARKAVADGADVIIARGNQAMYIKQHLAVPVVDIRITAQELGILIRKAKKLSKLEYPKIAIIVNTDMLPDITHLGELYDAEIESYIMQPGMDIKLLLNQVVERHTDVIIGGSNVMVEAAGSYGIPSVHVALTQDGLREAFRVAMMMKYAIDVEKKSNAQIKALLDNSFTGILRTDRTGEIITINPFFQTLLRKKEKEIVGRKIQQIFPPVEQQEIEQVLDKGQAVYSTYTIMEDNTVSFMMVPVIVEEMVEGMMVFCCLVQKSVRNPYQTDMQPAERNYFDKFFSSSSKMRQCIHLAKVYLQSRNPILILGEAGTEKKELAHSIYMSSLNRNGPMVCVDCRNLSEEEQAKVIFGKTPASNYVSAIKRAQNGVLLLLNIEYLSLSNQSRLYDVLTYNYLMEEADDRPMLLNARVLVTGTKALKSLVENGRFQAELYYTLMGLMIEIPPIRERKEDLTQAIDTYFDLYANKYSRFFTLTKGARNYMIGYPWFGNLTQLDHFCEKLILFSNSRVINETMVIDLLREMELIKSQDIPVMPEAETDSGKQKVLNLLEKYHGNRQDVADELGISKVTLWRWMNKYGLK